MYTPKSRNESLFHPILMGWLWRVYIVLLPALLLVACTAEPTDPASSSFSSRPVHFTTYVPLSSPTRASATYLADGGIPEGQSIGIFAYYHDDDDWSTAPATATPNFMFNQRATNATPGSYYTYSPLKYWPNEHSDKISFIAYYPYTATSASSTGITHLLTSETSAALPSYRFTVHDDPALQVDFLVSHLLTSLPNGTQAVTPSGAADRSDITTTDRVRFPLHHATSKVVFTADVPDSLRLNLACYKVESLAVKNLYKSGTLAYDADGQDFHWTPEEDSSQDYSFRTGEYQLLLPQTLADDVLLTIDYSLTFKTDGTVFHYEDGQPVADNEYTFRNTATLRLNEYTKDQAWLPHHVYHYHLHLGARRIEFTGEVVEWGAHEEITDIIWN